MNVQQIATQVNQQPAAQTDKLFSVSFFNNKHDNSAKQETHFTDKVYHFYNKLMVERIISWWFCR